MSNHGDIERGLDFDMACRPCGGTVTHGFCYICRRDIVPKDIGAETMANMDAEEWAAYHRAQNGLLK